MIRAAMNATIRPAPRPTAISFAPCPTTSFNTSRGRAPIAMRTPISRVRWLTTTAPVDGEQFYEICG